jgi:pimeloyl-ACP methyl ester carboxylesterase
MRRIALILAGFMLANPALAATSKTAAHVYLLRGILNVFSPGIDTLGAKLAQRGIDVTVTNHLAWAGLAEQAIRDCKSGLDGPIILIGHSLGGGAVVDMANRLGQEGVRVSLLATLDPVAAPRVGGNVSRVVNYYLSNGLGSAVDRGAGFHGQIQNTDMKGHSELGHVALTTSDSIQAHLIADVLAAMHGRCR